MQISHNGLQLVKDSEGFRADAYKDSVGVWTIGYGTTRINGTPVLPGMHCTPEEAELYLQADMSGVQTMLNQAVKVRLSQGMFDALCSFAYNLGTGALRDSTLLRLLNKGDYIGASNEFLRWDMAGGKRIAGLHSRRLREQSLFNATN